MHLRFRKFITSSIGIINDFSGKVFILLMPLEYSTFLLRPTASFNARIEALSSIISLL